jgi:hypothetical protein
MLQLHSSVIHAAVQWCQSSTSDLVVPIVLDVVVIAQAIGSKAMVRCATQTDSIAKRH